MAEPPVYEQSEGPDWDDASGTLFQRFAREVSSDQWTSGWLLMRHRWWHRGPLRPKYVQLKGASRRRLWMARLRRAGK